MNQQKVIYPDRYDLEYLEYLSTQFNIESLKKNALFKPKTINNVLYQRCINIDFCGLGASTLFFTNLNNEYVTGKNLDARRKVSIAFKNIFTKDFLSEINKDDSEERFYLKVRFCFSYLYSDFPICLMKAEQKETWENIIEKPTGYFINDPLSIDEFDISATHTSQKESLKAIKEILEDNSDLIILGGQEKKVNTIQVRFCCIPSTVCTLIINNTAYCDTYLYAKLGMMRQLSMNYPVIILENENPITSSAYDSIRKHFYYLWRHDLTLYCGDATEFKPNNIKGLTKILSPDHIIGIKGTNWAHKERRIWEKKEDLAGEILTKSPEENWHIEKWKYNLNNKLSVCTRKIDESNANTDDRYNYISIRMHRKFFYLKIEIKSDNTCIEYQQPEANLLFCVMAHYSFAIRNNKIPILHALVSKNDLKKEIKTQLLNWELDKKYDKSISSSGNDLFNKLFMETPDFGLKVLRQNISIDKDDLEEIKKASYSSSKYGRISCLEFDMKKFDI